MADSIWKISLDRSGYTICREGNAAKQNGIWTDGETKIYV